MKKLILLFLMGFSFIGCSSSDDSSTPSGGDTFATAPEAKEEHDDSNYGVYKGIFTGSSGIVYVNIYNSGSISAKMVIDGTTYNFTTSGTVTDGQEIANLLFSSGSNSFHFNVLGNGEDPVIDNINIASHPNAAVQMFKEYSFAQIKCYEGTFAGGSVGTFNLATAADGYALGLAKPNDEDGSIYLDGTFTGNSLSGTFEGGTFSGTIGTNTISGTWQNNVQESGTWTANRKM